LIKNKEKCLKSDKLKIVEEKLKNNLILKIKMIINTKLKIKTGRVGVS